MTAPQRIEFSIPSHPIFLRMVRAVMEKAAEILCLPEDLAERIVLAVDEASSNVIKHAYGNRTEGRLEFLIELGPERLDISITDYGEPCDIRAIKPRDLDDVRPGGLGTYIIGEVMDRVDYTCGENNRNRIQMTKHLQK